MLGVGRCASVALAWLLAAPWCAVAVGERGKRGCGGAGGKRSVRMESNDIAAGLDDMRYSGYGDADDDVDFM